MAIAQYETSQYSFRWKDLEERNRHIQDLPLQISEEMTNLYPMKINFKKIT